MSASLLPAERRSPPKAAERSVCLHERVLRRFLGVLGVPGEEVCGAKGDSLVHADELLVRVLIPARSLGDELRVLEWSAHHLPYYTGSSDAVPSRRPDPQRKGFQLVAQSLLRDRVRFRTQEPSRLMT